MPQGQVIGRVSVRVLPDTSQFRRKTENELGKIEKRLKVEVQVIPNMTGFERQLLTEVSKISQRNRQSDARKVKLYTRIDTSTMTGELAKAIRKYNAKAQSSGKVQLQTELDAGDVHLKISDESLRKMTDQLKDWRDRNSPLKIKIEPDVAASSSLATSARLGFLTRPRTVSIIPKLNEAAVTKVATALAALSGARVLKKLFSEIGEVLSNLDRSVPVIGSLAAAIAGVAGFALSAASNLFSLSASLAQIGPTVALLPGLLGGFAVGLGVTIAAFKDFNKVIPEVKQTLSGLQDTISKNFWAKAEEPIRNMVDSLLPAFRKGVADTATELGGFFGSFAKNLGTSLSPAMGQMFDDLSKSIAIATTGTGAFAEIIATLGKVGTSYLPQLSQWFVNLSTQFADFLKAKGENGIKAEIDQGIQALKDLGGVLYNTYGILSGVAKAATEAGGTSLGSLNKALADIHATVDSPGFQSGLVDVFKAAHTAMDNIATQSGPAVENLFKTLGQLLTTVLPQAGQIIGTALGAVADALAQPAVTKGIEDLFTGLQGAVTALAPALAPVGQALGAIFSVVGAALPVFAQLISSAITPLAGAFATLLPQLTPIITLLGGALTQAFQTLAPYIEQLVPVVGQALGAAFQFLGTILPPIAQIFGQILQAVMPLAQALMDALAPILPVLADALKQIFTALGPVIDVALQIISAVIEPLLPMLSEVIQSVLPPLADAISRVVEALKPFLDALLAVVNFLMPILVPVIQFIVELLAGALVAAINGVGLVLEGLKEFFVGMWEYVSSWFQLFYDLFTGNWSKLGDDLKGIWDGILGMLKGVWDIILGALEFFFNVGILGTAGKALKGLGALFKAGWKAITELFTGAFAAIRGYIGVFLTGAKGLFMDGIKAIGKFFSDGWSSIVRGVTSFFSGLSSRVTGGLSAVKGFFSSAWSSIKSTAGSALSSLISTIGTWIGKAVTTVKSLPGKAKAALGSLGSTLIEAGKALIRGLISGISSMFGAVKSKLGDLTSKLTDWKGPLPKDKVLLYNAGVVIIKGLIKGLESQYDNVKKSLEGLTSLIGKAKLSKGLTAKLKGDQKQLNSLLSSWNKLNDKLDEAKKNLADLKKAKSDYAASIAQKIIDDANVTQMEGGFTGIIEQLTMARDQAKHFADVLGKLKKLGLNQEMFDQLAQAGPQAGMAAAEAILGAGQAGVDQVNKLEDQIKSAADKVGATASQVMYDNGIHMAEGLVKGLESQADKIEKQMLKIADSMVKAIKKALGIHSPSRVLKKIGAYVGQGFQLGLLSERSNIAQAVEDSLLVGTSSTGTARNIASAVGSALGGNDATASPTKVLNYYAAPGSSLSSEEDLFAAANRARMGW
ncbi:tape measure protein [Streptomyces phage Issmi]|uniref:Tape measure protein n=1 Tax=Streptomyces phage Issmi TaxID=2725628 RepID=A0A6M3SXF2_9CAUD|nr:tail length tape measure protein [Streptomyces phage Issmi]QJD50665.1 tape measure protein [Streptomyces phage Issmi]